MRLKGLFFRVVFIAAVACTHPAWGMDDKDSKSRESDSTAVWQHGLSLPSEPPRLEKSSEESKELTPASGSSRWFKSSEKKQDSAVSEQSPAAAPVSRLAAKAGKTRIFVSGLEKPKTETLSSESPASESSAKTSQANDKK